MCGLFYEHSKLEYIRAHVISRVNQAEYGIRILVAAPQEDVNIYSTRRTLTLKFFAGQGWHLVSCGGRDGYNFSGTRPKTHSRVEDSTLQAVTDAHGLGANSAQPHGLG